MKNIFEAQKVFQTILGIRTEYITNTDKYQDATVHLVRAQDELNEAMRMLPIALGGMSKTSSTEKINMNAFTLEMVDAFLFMVNAMNIMGIEPAEFYQSIEVKQAMNIARLQNKERFMEYKEYPLIIIDGPDGVGKTEICRKLGERLHLNVVRMPVPYDMNHIESASRTWNSAMDQMKTTVVCDRGYPSSMVYSRYFGRPEIDLQYIKDLFKDRDVFIFIITADGPYRADDFITQYDFLPIQNYYIQLANENQWQIIHNNVSTDTCVQQIITALQY